MASITRKITSLEQGQSLIQWIRDNVKKGLQEIGRASCRERVFAKV